MNDTGLVRDEKIREVKKNCCYPQEVPKVLAWLFASIVEERKNTLIV